MSKLETTNTYTDLEAAHALRSTAEWVRTAPNSERCSGLLAARPVAESIDGIVGTSPLDPRASRHCAIGKLCQELDVENYDSVLRALGRGRAEHAANQAFIVSVYSPFDTSVISNDPSASREEAARRLELEAERIEALIAETPEPAVEKELTHA